MKQNKILDLLNAKDAIIKKALAPQVIAQQKFNVIDYPFYKQYEGGIWQLLDNLKKYQKATDAIRKVYQTYDWVYDLKIELKKGKEISNGKARELDAGAKILRASNQVLGLVCYYAGCYTKEQIQALLEKMDLYLLQSNLYEIARYRNSFLKSENRIFERKKPTTKALTARNACITTAIEIQKEYSLKGKSKARSDKKTLENYYN